MDVNIKKVEGSTQVAEPARTARVYSPAVDIVETADSIVLTADIPGVDEKSVEVTLENDVLRLEGHATAPAHQGFRLSAAEYGVGDYRREFSISSEIDREKIRATVRNGVLRLTLPKAEPARKRRIAIEAA
jgi:HSP20 family protein